MAARDGKDPLETGEIKAQSRCDVCGVVSETVSVVDRPPPNRFCLRCAVEYGDSTTDYEDY